ncbi:hypothetical protein BH10BAC5_BH10BAC5_25940 [soil metagenome]
MENDLKLAFALDCYIELKASNDFDAVLVFTKKAAFSFLVLTPEFILKCFYRGREP